jgi:hypothetical protein
VRGLTPRRALLLVAVLVVVVVGGLAIAVGPQLLSTSSPAVPHFVAEGSASGVDHVYSGDFDYYVGGGVAAFDCNDDGRPELYFAGGSGPAALYLNESTAGGALKFQAKPDPLTDLDAVTGAYPIDVDGDGITDLAVMRNGAGNVLLRGLGDCNFANANSAWGFDGGSSWSTAFSATWEQGANWPTLAVGNYVDQSRPLSAGDICFDNALYRPSSDSGGFAAATPLTPGWCALSMLFSSWDRSGRADLRVSNDRHYYGETSGGEEQLWRVAPGEAPRQYTAADGWQPLRISGMGIGSYDVNGDGYPDYYLTSQGDSKLQVLASPGEVGQAEVPQYKDIALSRGVTATRPYAGDTTLPSTAWDPSFADVNNDGLIDLFVTKGNVEAQADFAMQDPNDLFLGQADGTFAEHAADAGLGGFDRGRGALLVDLNLDGLLDMVVVNRVEPAGIWRNVGSGSADQPAALGHWLQLRLDQDGANRDAIGSWIEVRAGDRLLSRELTIGGGHDSGQLGWTHFGLGSESSPQVRVTWPDGSQTGWLEVGADRFTTIDKEAGTATPWTPPAP